MDVILDRIVSDASLPARTYCDALAINAFVQAVKGPVQELKLADLHAR